jgi:hypothetical protein
MSDKAPSRGRGFVVSGDHSSGGACGIGYANARIGEKAAKALRLLALGTRQAALPLDMFRMVERGGGSLVLRCVGFKANRPGLHGKVETWTNFVRFLIGMGHAGSPLLIVYGDKPILPIRFCCDQITGSTA